MENDFIKKYGMKYQTGLVNTDTELSVPVSKKIKPYQVYKDMRPTIKSGKTLAKQSPIRAGINKFGFPQRNFSISKNLSPEYTSSIQSVHKRNAKSSFLDTQNQGLPNLNSIKSYEKFDKRRNKSRDTFSVNKLDIKTDQSYEITPQPTNKKCHRNSSHNRNLSTKGSRRKTNYQPYTLKDYKETQPIKYLLLGGLGASNIGMESWKVAKMKRDRAKAYDSSIKAIL